MKGLSYDSVQIFDQEPLMRTKTSIVVPVILVGLAFHTNVPAAMAQDEATEMRELDARITKIQAALDDLRTPIGRYYVSWVAIMSTVALSQGALALFVADETKERATFWVASGAGLAGLLSVVAPSYPGFYASGSLRSMADGTLQQKRDKLVVAEELLEAEARSIERSRGFWAHVPGVLLAAGAGLYLGLAYDDNLPGALRVSGVVLLLSELRIWTRPTRGREYLQSYKNERPAVSLLPVVGRDRAFGLSMNIAF
jgi:hypothetical protein